VADYFRLRQDRRVEADEQPREAVEDRAVITADQVGR
jgi:hypothetical protein